MPKPSDAGGVAARQGFKYQDHVAATFVLRMIDDPGLLRVECETADDILLVWSDGLREYPEYVQVKTTEKDSKWSQKEICARDSGAASKRPTSLVEKSLLCDCHGPNARFRIVSRRDVNKGLQCLKLPLDSRAGNTALITLGQNLAAKRKTTSQNGNDLSYWTEHALWQVTGPIDGLIARNLQQLADLAERYGANPTHSHSKQIYEDLLAIVDRSATASGVTNAPDKVITRLRLLDWWGSHLGDTAAATRASSKPYRIATDGFFAELHHVSEDQIQRAVSGYDARYERKTWRSEQLAEYLADWLPEVALKASELVEVQHLNLRERYRTAIRQIKRQQHVDPERLLGEMLLHAVLRHHFRSEPIACKLFYQSQNGAAISPSNAHIIHRALGRDELWLGRTCLAREAAYEAVMAALTTELEAIVDTDFLKEEREVILSLREPQHLLPTTLEAALARNSPVDDLLRVLCIPILIGYDSNVLAGGFREDYEMLLLEEVKYRYDTLKPTLPPAVELIKVHIFLVPIENIERLITQFTEKVSA